MDNIELRTAPAELRATASGKICGYASRFNEDSLPLWDGLIERVAPGAFTKALVGSDVRCLWQHDSSTVLGREKAGTLTLREDAQGLWVEITPPDSPAGRDALEAVRRGDVDQMSIGFLMGRSTTEERPDGVRVRTVIEVEKLLEVSPVTWPAFPSTSIEARSRRVPSSWAGRSLQDISYELYQLERKNEADQRAHEARLSDIKRGSSTRRSAHVQRIDHRERLRRESATHTAAIAARLFG